MDEPQNIPAGASKESPGVSESPSTIPQGPTGNYQSSTEKMEVHHHPQLAHKPKPWKEYILEYLMIFLAVTTGFFAESYREHLTEKNKEKEYMKEIVANLKYDSIRCSLNKINNVQFSSGLDSLRNELKKAISGNINTNALYYFAMQYANVGSRAVFNTSAITELKNSGSLRLIENKKLVGELADYYERKISGANSYLPVLTDLLKSKNDLFSLLNLDDYIMSYNNIINTTYSISYNYQNILQHKPVLQLLQNSPAAFEQFYNQVSLFEIQIKQYNFWLYYCGTAATKLIASIQKEYHLENE